MSDFIISTVVDCKKRKMKIIFRSQNLKLFVFLTCPIHDENIKFFACHYNIIMRRRSGRAHCNLPTTQSRRVNARPTLYYSLIISTTLYLRILPFTITLYSYPIVVGNKILCEISPNDPIDIIIYYECTCKEPCGRRRGTSSDEKFLAAVRRRRRSDCPVGEVAALPGIVCQLPSPAWLILYYSIGVGVKITHATQFLNRKQ